MIGVFVMSTGISFATSYAYGLPKRLSPDNDAQRSLAPFAGSADMPEAPMLRRQDLRSMTSSAMACLIEPGQRMVQRLMADEPLQDALAASIGETYRIGQKEAEAIVETAINVSNLLDVDPFIVLGIASVESSMNRNAQSSYGAAGLMQVYAPVHMKLLQDLGIEPDAAAAAETLKADLEINLLAGAQIYRQYLKQYRTVPKALQAYNGARNDATRKYARKVLKARNYYEQSVRMREQLPPAHAAIENPSLGIDFTATAKLDANGLATIVAFAPRSRKALS